MQFSVPTLPIGAENSIGLLVHHTCISDLKMQKFGHITDKRIVSQRIKRYRITFKFWGLLSLSLSLLPL